MTTTALTLPTKICVASAVCGRRRLTISKATSADEVAWWVFCLGSLVYFVASLATKPPTKEQIEGVTWESPIATLRRSPGQDGADPRWLAGLLLVLLAIL